MRRDAAAADTILNPFAQQALHTQPQIQAEHALFALLLTIVVVVRLANLDFNTLHPDEAASLAVGKEALSRAALSMAAPIVGGSHLYPVLAALVEGAVGLLGLRALSVALMAAATMFVYLTAYRSYSSRAALWAAFLFGLTGISLNLGEFAVPDALAVPLVTASFFLATTSIVDRRQARMPLAGAAFGLGAVTSFAALLILPAFVLWVLLITAKHAASHAETAGRVAWDRFGILAGLILGLYALLARPDLQALGLYQPQIGTAGLMARDMLRDIGLPAVLALISLPILGGPRARFSVLSVKEARAGVVSALLASACLVAVWAFALCHFATLDTKWLWRHEVYALIILALFSGHGIDEIVRGLRATTPAVSIPVRALGAATMLLLVLGSGANALAHNAGWQRSWPNVGKVLDALREETIGSRSRLWTTANTVYHHYLDAIFVEGLSVSPDRMDMLRHTAAECGLDYVIVDDFTAPVAWEPLDALMRESHYYAKHTVAETLTGEVVITTKVYAPGVPCRFF